MYQVTFPQQSNRASWAFVGLITDTDNNPLDLTGMGMVFSVRAKTSNSPQSYYPQSYSDPGAVSLFASTDNGKITFIAPGTFRWFFTLDEMRGLCPGTYDTGLTLTSVDGTQTVQFFIGPLPIIDGIVP
jgi:hypothetical protein